MFLLWIAHFHVIWHELKQQLTVHTWHHNIQNTTYHQEGYFVTYFLKINIHFKNNFNNIFYYVYAYGQSHCFPICEEFTRSNN